MNNRFTPPHLEDKVKSAVRRGLVVLYPPLVFQLLTGEEEVLLINRDAFACKKI